MNGAALRRRVTAAGVVALAGLVWLAWAPAAGAHAALMSSDPSSDAVVETAPRTVSMTFSEPVVALPGSVEIYGPDGQRVDDGVPSAASGDTVVRTGVEADVRGSYTVSWRVTSDDGHTINGSWTFHVGERSGASTAADAPESRSVGVVGWAGRVMFTAGLVCVVGSAVVGRNRFTRRGRTRRLTVAAGALVLAGSVIVLVSRVAEATGRGFFDAVASSPEFVEAARSGQLDAFRVLLSLALLGTIVAVRARRADVVVGVLSSAVALVAAMSGHAAVTSLPALSTVVDAIHLLAAGVWVGGLVLVLVELDDPIPMARWSTLAAVSLGVVALTGVISGVFQVGVPRGMWETDYGQLLMVKVALVAVMVTLGWLNRGHLAELTARTRTALTRLRIETGVGLGVLAVTAVFVTTVPAVDSLAQPFSGSTRIGSLDATVTVDPARVGDNQVHIFFTRADGGPGSVDAAELTVSGPGIEPARVPLTPIAPNHFAALQAPLGRPGTWTAELAVVVDGNPAAGLLTIPVR